MDSYMSFKIDEATVNVYFDEAYDASDDDQAIQDDIQAGRYTPAIIEVLVWDTTGLVYGSDLLGGCLVADDLDVRDCIATHDMILMATKDMRDRVNLIIYHNKT